MLYAPSRSRRSGVTGNGLSRFVHAADQALTRLDAEMFDRRQWVAELSTITRASSASSKTASEAVRAFTCDAMVRRASCSGPRRHARARAAG